MDSRTQVRPTVRSFSHAVLLQSTAGTAIKHHGCTPLPSHRQYVATQWAITLRHRPGVGRSWKRASSNRRRSLGALGGEGRLQLLWPASPPNLGDATMSWPWGTAIVHWVTAATDTCANVISGCGSVQRLGFPRRCRTNEKRCSAKRPAGLGGRALSL